jgi:hypothetical protein
MKTTCFYTQSKKLYTTLLQLKKNWPESLQAEIIRLLKNERALWKKEFNPFVKLSHQFPLSNLEEWIIFLSICLEAEPRIHHFLADHLVIFNKNHITFRLLSYFIADSQQKLIDLDSILFHENLIYIDKRSGLYLIDSALRLSESLLNFLFDIHNVDPKLSMLTKAQADDLPSDFLLENYPKLRQRFTDKQQEQTLHLLLGQDESLQEMLATQLIQPLAKKITVITVNQLPNSTLDLYQCLQLLRQHTLLNNHFYCFNFHQINEKDVNEKEWLITTLVSYSYQLLLGLCIFISQHDFFSSAPGLIKWDIETPNPQQWKTVWKYFLAEHYTYFADELDKVIAQFELTIYQIKTIVALLPKRLLEKKTKPERQALLWNLCRTHARKAMLHWASLVKSKAQRHAIVLPDTQKKMLEQLIAQVQNRFLVYHTWGLANKEKRGLGITALFYGSSGTGKTMAAEVIAERLHLDLYRIDLSQIVSKYIGETQKNLQQVFSLAEKSGAILLFDEADSLFSKRSSVKETRDRYANMEVNYLLSRMENYRGLSLLTTNLKDNIDSAFLRRFRFVIEFYYPNQSQREQLWRKLFSYQPACKTIDCKKLSAIDINGASIRNVLINAAFLAAQHKETLTLSHLKEALQQEFLKLERPLNPEVMCL